MRRGGNGMDAVWGTHNQHTTPDAASQPGQASARAQRRRVHLRPSPRNQFLIPLTPACRGKATPVCVLRQSSFSPFRPPEKATSSASKQVVSETCRRASRRQQVHTSRRRGSPPPSARQDDGFAPAVDGGCRDGGCAESIVEGGGNENMCDIKRRAVCGCWMWAAVGKTLSVDGVVSTVG